MTLTLDMTGSWEAVSDDHHSKHDRAVVSRVKMDCWKTWSLKLFDATPQIYLLLSHREYTVHLSVCLWCLEQMWLYDFFEIFVQSRCCHVLSKHMTQCLNTESPTFDYICVQISSRRDVCAFASLIMAKSAMDPLTTPGPSLSWLNANPRAIFDGPWSC